MLEDFTCQGRASRWERVKKVRVANLIHLSDKLQVIDTIWAANLYGIYKASRRRAVVNPIQIGREYCIVLKVRMHLNNHVNQLFW